MTQESQHRVRSILEMVNMVAGLLIWFAHLTVIYVVHALVCARGYVDAQVLGIGVVPFAVGIATVVAVIGSVLVLVYALHDLRDIHESPEYDPPDRFLAYTTATVASFSLLAIVWEALPALFIRSCA